MSTLDGNRCDRAELACACALQVLATSEVTHAGAEELHLPDGELWIDGRLLVPGDYHDGAPGANDERVWSETGCTCVLVASTKDALR